VVSVVALTITAIVSVTEGVDCGEIQVHPSGGNGNFPEISCCSMFQASMCLWVSIGDPSANVSQRAEPTGGVIITEVGYYGQFNCINLVNGMILQKLLYLPGE